MLPFQIRPRNVKEHCVFTTVSSSSGFGQGVRQGQGLAVSRGAGFGVENEYSESSLRVFLQQYTANAQQCGVFNVSRKPNFSI